MKITRNSGPRVHSSLCSRLFSRRRSDWRICLSVNPEVSDGTAIWVERKFNIPESGEWLEEVAFTIPITKTSSPSGEAHPGLVVFECTPIESVDDEIERWV
jgi:hypothetical protein